MSTGEHVCYKGFTQPENSMYQSLSAHKDLIDAIDEIRIIHLFDPNKLSYFSPINKVSELDANYLLLENSPEFEVKGTGPQSDQEDFKVIVPMTDMENIVFQFEKLNEAQGKTLDEEIEFKKDLDELTVRNNKLEDKLILDAIKLRHNRRPGKIYYFPADRELSSLTEASSSDKNSEKQASTYANVLQLNISNEYKIMLTVQNASAGEKLEITLFDKSTILIDLNSENKEIFFDDWNDYDPNIDLGELEIKLIPPSSSKLSLVNDKSQKENSYSSNTIINRLTLYKSKRNSDIRTYSEIKYHQIDIAAHDFLERRKLSLICQPGSFLVTTETSKYCQTCDVLNLKYQDKAAQTECKSCDKDYVGIKGDVCSRCPAGVDCSLGKLPEDCPAGSFCVEGELKPRVCMPGYFCPSKMLLNPLGIVNANSNCLEFNDEQSDVYQCDQFICPKGYACTEQTSGFVETIYSGEDEKLPEHYAKPDEKYLCTEGSYQDEEGQSACKECPENSGTWDPNTEKELKGKTSIDDCTADPGYWKVGDNYVALTVCETNQYETVAPSAGVNRECADCEIGFYCDSLLQKECPQYYFCDALASLDDFENKETADPNTAKIAICDLGKDCSQGSVKKGEQPECPSEHFCLQAKDPEPWRAQCVRGEYIKVEPSIFNDRECDSCPPGKYCEEIATLDQAKDCAAGYYCLANSISERGAGLCQKGYYCESGSSSAEGSGLCPAGRFCVAGSKSAEGSGLCSPGYFCQAGSYSKKGNSIADPNQGLCKAGFYCAKGSESEEGQGPCPAGRFCPKGSGLTLDSITGQEKIGEPCPPGRYCEEGSSSQAGSGPCAPGRYCPGASEDENGAGPCAAGYYCETVEDKGAYNFKGLLQGESQITRICKKGYYCPEGSVNSQGHSRYDFSDRLCPGGYFCPPGTSGLKGETLSNFSEKRCPKSYYCQEGTAAETDTEPDKNDDPSIVVEKKANLCPHHSSTDMSDSIINDHINDCLANAGYYLKQDNNENTYIDIDDSISLVESAYYSSALNNIKSSCPEGKQAIEESKLKIIEEQNGESIELSTKLRISEAQACEDCKKGHYAPEKAMVNCLQADPGYFVSKTGQTMQQLCLDGFYTDVVASSECTACSLGKQGIDGVAIRSSEASSCEDCPAGLYADSTGLASCKQTQQGYYASDDKSSEIICPTGSFCLAGLREECDLGSYADTTAMTACLQADLGHFVDKTGQAAQTPCDLGNYADTTGMSLCKQAEPGYYVGASAQAQQTACEDGFYSTQAQASSCTACSMGKQGVDGVAIRSSEASSCENCPAGLYADSTGLASCKQTQQGYYASDDKSSEIICPTGSFCSAGLREECDLGSYADTTAMTACLQADLGHFVDKTGQAAQTPCDLGNYADTVGMSLCKQAEPGYYVGASAQAQQTACEDGFYSTQAQASSCTACSLGKQGIDGVAIRSSEASSCEDCPAGLYADSTGLASCKQTQQGYYASADKSSEIICPTGSFCSAGLREECDLGSYADTTAMTACLQADLGHFVDKTGQAAQTPCDLGNYADTVGMSLCKQAEPGYYVGASAQAQQTACEDGFYSAQAQASSCTACSMGKQGVDGVAIRSSEASSCEDCPAGLYADSTGLASCKQTQQGYYASSDKQTEIICPTGSFCVAGIKQDCAKGTYQDQTGQTECKEAEKGFFVSEKGQASQSECAKGFYSSSTKSETCTIAQAGYYVDKTKSAEQTPCQAGTYNPNTGSTSQEACIDADAGYIVATPGQSEQSICLPGSYSNLGKDQTGSSSCTYARAGYIVATAGQSEETICQAGSFSNKGDGKVGSISCTAAQAGYIVALAGQSKESICLAGSFSNNGEGQTGSTECLPARAGYKVAEAGQSKDIICEAGTYSNKGKDQTGSSSCTAAQAGYFVADSGASEENPCETGSFSLTTNQLSCVESDPGYETTGENSSLKAATGQTECLAGTYSNKGKDQYGSFSCTPAPAGSIVATAGQSEASICQAGFYSEKGKDQTGSTSCTAAQIGYYVANTGQSEQKECETGTFTQQTGQSSCTASSPGYETTGENLDLKAATGQTECLAGTYSNKGKDQTGSTSCTVASAGYYVANSAQSEETPCEIGTFTSEQGQSFCIASDPGYETTGENSELQAATGQTECLAGTYSNKGRNQQGSTSCIPAQAGYAVEFSGQTEETICEAGTFSNNGKDQTGSTSCTLAKPGYYVASSAQSEESPCEPGTYSSESGQSSCIASDPGYQTIGENLDLKAATDQEVCSAGSYSNAGEGNTGSTTCTPARVGHIVASSGQSTDTICEAGSYSNAGEGNTGSTTCTPARVGHIVASSGQSTDTICEAGSYSNAGEGNTGSTTCTPARVGHIVASSGQSTDTICEAGSYSNAGEGNTGSTTCTPARVGHIVASSGQSTDTICEAGSYSNAGEGNTGSTTCTPARVGHIVASSGQSTDTICEAGSYSNAGEGNTGSTTCTPAREGHIVASSGQSTDTICEAGSYSNAGEGNTGSTTCTPARAGYYITSSGSSKETACANGTYNPNEGSTSQQACLSPDAEHYVDSNNKTTQIAWQTCSPGYGYQAGSTTSNASCNECSNGTFSTGNKASCRAPDAEHYVDSSNKTTQIAWQTCSPGYGYQAGSTTSNASCNECNNGTFSTGNKASCRAPDAEHYVDSNNKTTQIAWQSCSPGTKVSVSPNSTRNRECSSCLPGTYSSSFNASSCTTASKGYYVANYGASQQTACLSEPITLMREAPLNKHVLLQTQNIMSTQLTKQNK